MTGQRLGADPLDRLDLGSGDSGGRRTWWRAAALVTAGGLIGWGAAHVTSPGGPAAQGTGDVRLVAGSFQQDLTHPFASDFLVTLSNSGTDPVVVLGVAPHGWVARASPVGIPPGRSADIPIDVTLRCLSSPPPSAMVDVRVAAGGTARTLELPMAGVPPALLEEYGRRCDVQSLHHATRRNLLGTWVVEDGGPGFSGKMLFRFSSDDRYAMDYGTHLDDDPGSSGRYRLEPRGRLTLRTLKGGHCGRRSKAVWKVGLQADGRLHIRQLTSYDGYCTVDRGDVWIAKRVVS